MKFIKALNIKEYQELFDALKTGATESDFKITKCNTDDEVIGNQVQFIVQLSKLPNGNKIAESYNSNPKISIYTTMKDHWSDIEAIRSKILWYYN